MKTMQNAKKKKEDTTMIAIPEFSENKDNAVALYFCLEGRDEAALRRQIEAAYVCLSRMGTTVKNGKRYLVAEIEDK